MGATKNMFLQMMEEDFNNLNEETRSLFTKVEVRENDEYENNKNDAKYLAYKKAESKAKAETQKYLFNKRHNLI